MKSDLQYLQDWFVVFSTYYDFLELELMVSKNVYSFTPCCPYECEFQESLKGKTIYYPMRQYSEEELESVHEYDWARYNDY